MSTESSIAVRHTAGAAPGIVWLGGYKSDMLGTKAETLSDWAAREGRAFLRHDYSGHGESGGAFADGTISKWLGAKPRRVPAFHQGQADPGRLLDGRLDRAAHGAGTAQGGRQPHRRPGAAGAGAGFHRRTGRAGADRGAEARPRRKGLLRGAVGLFRRALHLHARADRGRPRQPGDDRADRHALPRPHPAGPGRSPTCRQAMR